MNQIYSYDIDGVINLDTGRIGIRPGSVNDVIISGRSTDELTDTIKFLRDNGIGNEVYLNPIPFEEKTRVLSGIHKGNTILALRELGLNITTHYEDDVVQIDQIMKIVPDLIIIHVNHNGIVNYENIKRG
jgi:hypothetical protein